jgi:hypothetical protein
MKVGMIEAVNTKSAAIAAAMMRSVGLHRFQSATISRTPAGVLGGGFRRRKLLGVSEMSVRRKTLAVMIYPKKRPSPPGADLEARALPRLAELLSSPSRENRES